MGKQTNKQGLKRTQVTQLHPHMLLGKKRSKKKKSEIGIIIIIYGKILSRNIHNLWDIPDLSIRSEPARSTTTSFPFRTMGGFNVLSMLDMLPFSLEGAESFPLTDLLTCTCNKRNCDVHQNNTQHLKGLPTNSQFQMYNYLSSRKAVHLPLKWHDYEKILYSILCQQQSGELPLILEVPQNSVGL